MERCLYPKRTLFFSFFGWAIVYKSAYIQSQFLHCSWLLCVIFGVRLNIFGKDCSGVISSLIAQLVKNRLQCRRPRFDSWVGKIPWRRDRLPTPVFLGFPGGSACKESTHNAVNTWVGKMPWRRGLPTPVFWPGEFHGLYSP